MGLLLALCMVEDVDSRDSIYSETMNYVNNGISFLQTILNTGSTFAVRHN